MQNNCENSLWNRCLWLIIGTAIVGTMLLAMPKARAQYYDNDAYRRQQYQQILDEQRREHERNTGWINQYNPRPQQCKMVYDAFTRGYTTYCN